MKQKQPRKNEQIAAIYERQFSSVWRLCRLLMKNDADAEDAAQDVFLRLIDACPALESETHERAWLLRVAANRCKSLLRLKWRRREDIDELPLAAAEPPDTGAVRQAVEHLPPHYKAPVYLYYYEDYSGEEIAQLLRLPASTVRSRLRRARLLLQKQLGDDFLEE